MRALLGVVAGLVSGSAPWLLPEQTPLFVRICLTLALLGIAVFAATSQGVVRKWSAIAVGVVVVGWVGVSIVTTPTGGDTAAEAIFEQTEGAAIWVARDPHMFEGSRPYLAANFEKLYAGQQRWTTPALDDATSPYGLIQDGAAFEGKSILTVGEVIGYQRWDTGELIIQLSALTADHAADPQVRNAITEKWPYAGEVDEMLSDTRVNAAQNASHLIYCRAGEDLFTGISTGDVLLVRGVLIAYGRTLIRAGDFADVAYMMCNEWDRVLDEAPGYGSTPSPSPEPTAK